MSGSRVRPAARIIGATEMALAAGTRLGTHEVIALIGVGGMDI
jgi:hypothetical protein